MNKELVKNIILFALGAYSCFLLHVLTPLDAVASSAVVGLIFSFIFKKHQAIIYCGSFAGMSSQSYLVNTTWLIPISIFGGLIFYYTKSIALGFGGKLGTIAFVSVSSLLLLRLFL